MVSQWKRQIPLGDYTIKPTKKGLLEAIDINSTMELEKLIECICACVFIFFIFSFLFVFFH